MLLQKPKKNVMLKLLWCIHWHDMCNTKLYILLQLWFKQHWKGYALTWLCSLHPTPPPNLLTVATRQLQSLFYAISSLVLRCLVDCRHTNAWQEAVMLLTCCATSLFMRTDSSRQTPAHLARTVQIPTQGTHTPRQITCTQTDEHTLPSQRHIH